MDSDEEQRETFAKQGGEALNLEEDFNDSEVADDDDIEKSDDSLKQGEPPKDVKGEKLDNQPYDLAVDVNDSEEIESDEEEDEVAPMNNASSQATNQNDKAMREAQLAQ